MRVPSFELKVHLKSFASAVILTLFFCLDVGKDQSKVDIDNTQFLDMVKVLPQLFKPTQQKLQMTKTSLQVGHHRPLNVSKA